MRTRAIMRMVVMMGVGSGGNHPRTLYYYIPPVHGGLKANLSVSLGAAVMDGNGPEPPRRTNGPTKPPLASEFRNAKRRPYATAFLSFQGARSASPESIYPRGLRPDGFRARRGRAAPE